MLRVVRDGLRKLEAQPARLCRHRPAACATVGIALCLTTRYLKHCVGCEKRTDLRRGKAVGALHAPYFALSRRVERKFVLAVGPGDHPSRHRARKRTPADALATTTRPYSLHPKPLRKAPIPNRQNRQNG
jgi:hypothetical protein